MKTQLITIAMLIVYIYSCNINPNKNEVVKNINKVINGKRQGVFLTFDDGGKITDIDNYKDDVLDGQCMSFHKNGFIEVNIHYKNGKEDGAFYSFYPSGYLETEREWILGNKRGLAFDYFDSTVSIKAMMYYNKNGKLIERNNYDKGGDLIKKEGRSPYLLPEKKLPIISK